MEFRHVPVLLRQCLEGLDIRPEGTYIDGTAGGGGHSSAIAERLSTGRLLAIDKDPDAVAAATERLAAYPQAAVARGDFREMAAVAEANGITRCDGILLDLGVSSFQLDRAERGFSYHQDGPLDMRMGGEGLSAADILNGWQPRELERIFRIYGEERFARRIAENIAQAREKKPLSTTSGLVDIIRDSIPAPARREGGHPAKRVFQAIRIAVNTELDALEQGLGEAFGLLGSGGRLAVITFHSLEDRIVKQNFAELCRGCTCPPDFPVCVCGNLPRARLVNRKPITAGEAELLENSRSKPAKLRVLEKI